MSALRTSVLVFLTLAYVSVYAGSVYFGGAGDTKTHWVGYRVSLATNSITWRAYVLDSAKRGRIQAAPATFRRAGTNTWTATFDEYAFRGGAVAVGLARHTLTIKPGQDPEVIQVQDGKETLKLRKVSDADLKVLESGRIPNQQGGANGRQPVSSDTNRTSAATAPRRSP